MLKMRYVWLALVALCCLFAGCGGGSVPEEQGVKVSYAPYVYMALRLNTAWVRGVQLFSSGGATKSTYDETTTIMRQVQLDGKPWYKAHITGLMETDMLYRRTPTAIFSHTGCLEDDGHCLLKGPLVAGTSWRVSGGWAAIKQVGLTVTVPAGTYNNCVLVVETLPTPYATWRTKTWYAPNVGEVKSEVWQDATICQRDLLKSFTGG